MKTCARGTEANLESRQDRAKIAPPSGAITASSHRDTAARICTCAYCVDVAECLFVPLDGIDPTRYWLCADCRSAPERCYDSDRGPDLAYEPREGASQRAIQEAAKRVLGDGALGIGAKNYRAYSSVSRTQTCLARPPAGAYRSAHAGRQAADGR